MTTSMPDPPSDEQPTGRDDLRARERELDRQIARLAAGRPDPLEVHSRNLRLIIAAGAALIAGVGGCAVWSDGHARHVAACEQLEPDSVAAECLDGVSP